MSDVPYFETPERSERLQLLIHLVNNAQEIPYVRAPVGVGKTRFAGQLATCLADDYAVAWLYGDTDQPFQLQMQQAMPDLETLQATRRAGARPGPLLDALAAVPSGDSPRGTEKKRIPWLWIVPGAVLATLLVLALLFQDRINRFFEPPGPPPAVAIDRSAEESPAPDQPPDEAVFRSDITAATGDAAPPEVPPVQALADEPVPRPELPELATPAAPAPVPAPAPQAAPPAQESAVSETAPADARDGGDDVLDAVIDAAISAAGQPPAGVTPEPQPKAPPAPSEVKPAQEKRPVEKAATKAQATAAPPKPQRPKPTVSKAGSALSGLKWLRAQPKTRYTLQLVGARDRAAVEAFIRKYHIRAPYAVFERDLGGRPWYSLVGGSYPSRDAAVAARARLPKGIAGVWPRTFASVHEQLKP